MNDSGKREWWIARAEKAAGRREDSRRGAGDDPSAAGFSERDDFLLPEDEWGFINIVVPSFLVEKNSEVVKFPTFVVVQGKPGVGLFGALFLVAEIGTIERFRSSHQLAAYAGLVPTTRSSGGKTTHGSVGHASNRWPSGYWWRSCRH